jgi:hypothetical protein
LNVSSSPSRTDVSGEWAEIDTTIEGTPGEGVLDVASPVYRMELNAGGAAGAGAPLGSITVDGHRLDVWFPAELPVPVLAGDQAFYTLAEGVRLIVTVEADGTGFLPIVELADPGAADRFRALTDAGRPADLPATPGDLVFTTAVSDGLDLVPGPDGGALVVDGEQETIFLSPPPIMWDSAGGSLELPESVTEVGEGDRTRSPGWGDTITRMPTAIVDTRIVVSPDDEMLTDAATAWPVYIDPLISGRRSAENVAVRSGGYTGPLYNWSTPGGEGAGYCTDIPTCHVEFRQRLAWEYWNLGPVTAAVGSDIISAGFTVYGTHAANCAATTTDLHMLGDIHPSSSWGSLDWAGYNLVSSRTETHSVNCGNTGWRTYDAKWAVQQFADNDSWTALSLGLKARDEGSMTGWKRFGHDATLSIEYNRRPDVPSMPQIDTPLKPCVTGANRPYINTTTPILSAVISDPDREVVDAYFEVSTTNVPTDVRWASGWTARYASPARIKAPVTAGRLANGGTYSWRVLAGDGARDSGWSQWCEFSVDATIPNKPSIAPVTTGVQAVYETGFERGGANIPGKFRLTPNGSDDVIAFEYSTVSATSGMTRVSVAPGVNSSAEVAFNPGSATGARQIYVRSIDRAENKSETLTYSFDVATPVEDAIYTVDKNTTDSGPKNGKALDLTDASWSAGPHQLFGSRDDDWALSFNGQSTVAMGTTPVLDTSKSFTVSAHVLLDLEPSQLGQQDHTALSQDGVERSGFQLGYRANCGTTDCWAFSMPDKADSSTTTAATVAGVKAGGWVHLVGEHNAATKTVRLWVCDVGTPSNPAIGEPVGSAPITRGAGGPWNASASFVLGRGKANGAPTNWWPGQIDNVRIFSGEVLDTSKLRRLCQGAEAESFGQGSSASDALDPTIRENAQ